MLLAIALTTSWTAGPPPDDDLWPAAREVIERRCLSCHGAEARKGGLAFADAETFRRGGDRGPVFDADTPETSRLLEAVGYRNPELAMPPDGELPADELEALRRWIGAGAPWPADPLSGQLANPELFAEEESRDLDDPTDWWAYAPLAAPPVPAVEDPEWSAHPVDAFIEARRSEAGLTAADPATPETLLRRATFGLLGLPPTLAQQAVFRERIAADGLDAAWRALIDELLESPHYGEHWARHWLDLVRYADTNGYERDGTKQNAWRYRDWVVRSLNADKPYDRFTIEQLAGDELVDESDGVDAAEAEALLATGYYRLGVWDDEPSDPKQALADELADVVDTTGQVFLGTTIGCARCHDHKADPILQADYYALTAFFNNLTSYGGGAFGQHLGGGMHRPVADAPGPFVLTPEGREEVVRTIDASLRGFAERLEVPLPGEEPEGERTSFVADARAAGGAATWRYLEGDPDTPAPAGWHTPAFDDAAWTEGSGGFGTRGTPGALVGTEWKTRRILLRTTFGLTELPDELVLSFHHDEDLAVFLNGQEIFSREGYRGDYDEVALEAEARNSLVVGRNVLAVSCRQTGGGQFVDVGLRTGRPEKPRRDWLAELKTKARSRPEHPDSLAVRALVARRDLAFARPATAAYPALVASEYGPDAPEQHVLLRGSAHAPGELVEPNVPRAFRHGAEVDFAERIAPRPRSTGRRLAFARWLFDEGRFLTARVMANRLWQFHFGRGLCPSPGDLGRLGVAPTHPELLDHLATELVARGWSLKAMHRYLMTSGTYRMASVGDPDALRSDPRNDLYARFDPRRLTAEEYRDAVLAVNGTLNPELFGPGVYPEMAPEVLATSSRPDHAWGYSPPEHEVRRSLYVFTKRSLRLPMLESLDQPDPDLPCPARFPTNVPTQALITLNGSFVHENAARLAERLAGETGSLREALARGVELALGRTAVADELERGEAFVAELRDEHECSEAEALRLFCVGLYNRNEFLWLD